ncbi:hypothetical protein P7K49_025805 [Saguinus oedipus]|uniref:Ig-like domain-containing protein n=1 Tax=Saguinus oedipus TaxID=9490 RepID=A0ABQ9UIP4_SAGOE|nr:hypothetical protein P7K49_025805 [Saguinus oedipus]
MTETPNGSGNSIPTELMEAGVVQAPSYKITEKRQAVAFWCDPVSGHVTLYWYRQILGQGPELLIQFQNEEVVDDSQLPKDQFSAERLKGINSTLKIQPAELGDSAMYLCASSLATALQRPSLLCAKLQAVSSLSAHSSLSLFLILPGRK